VAREPMSDPHSHDDERRRAIWEDILRDRAEWEAADRDLELLLARIEGRRDALAAMTRREQALARRRCRLF
jgi:hypothetical protein